MNNNDEITFSESAAEGSQEAINRVVSYYQEALKSSPVAIEYLRSRGFDDAEMLEHFGVGYSNRTLSSVLPDKKSKAGGKLREELQTLGIFRESGHEHFNGSITVPVFDAKNQLVQIYGRKVLGKRLKKGTAQHLTLPIKSSGILNASAVSKEFPLIVTDSVFDAMSFWVSGFRNVIAVPDAQLIPDYIKGAGFKAVILAVKADTESIKKSMSGAGISVSVASFSNGCDANDVLQKGGTEALKALVKEAESSLNGSSNADNMRVTSKEIIFKFGEQYYRVRGLDNNRTYEVLKVNISAESNDRMFVDTLDLYAAKNRHQFIKATAEEFNLEENIIKRDIGRVITKLEGIRDKTLDQTQETTEPEPMTQSDQEQALALLKQPDLLQQILKDLDTCGLVGEETNKLVTYIALSSRKLRRPLAILIQSTSAAGKSSLMEAVLELMPDEDRVQYSAMTGQSLYYMGRDSLRRKVLAISEEDGIGNSYGLKLLQSEGRVSLSSTTKDANSGDTVTKTYQVEGPVMLIMTTTSIDIDEELVNRCLVLTVNESRGQTEAIHGYQRFKRTLQGLEATNAKLNRVQLHRNAQRLLRPLMVINPYAEQLTFLSTRTRARRDHEKYLTLIDSIAFLHQYQREVKTMVRNGETIEYIEVQINDIRIANELAHEVLGRSLDELPPQTRNLLNLIQEMVREACQRDEILYSDFRFSRKDIRDFTQWSDAQLKTHCGRLTDLEYLYIHSGGHGNPLVYELLCDASVPQKAQLMGLIDTKNLNPSDRYGSSMA